MRRFVCLIALSLALLALCPSVGLCDKPVMLCLNAGPQKWVKSGAAESARLALLEEFSAREFEPLDGKAVAGLPDCVAALRKKADTSESLKKFTEANGIDLLLVYEPELTVIRTPEDGRFDTVVIDLAVRVVDGYNGGTIAQKKGHWKVDINKGVADPQNYPAVRRVMNATGKAVSRKLLEMDAVIMRYLLY